MPQIKIGRSPGYACIVGTAGVDANAGRHRGLFATVSAASLATISSDTVLVQPGTFSAGGTALATKNNVWVLTAGSTITSSNATNVFNPAGKLIVLGSGIIQCSSTGTLVGLSGNNSVIYIDSFTNTGTNAVISGSVTQEIHFKNLLGTSGGSFCGLCGTDGAVIVIVGTNKMTSQVYGGSSALYSITSSPSSSSANTSTINISNSRIYNKSLVTNGAGIYFTGAGNYIVNLDTCEIWGCSAGAPLGAASAVTSVIYNLNNCIWRSYTGAVGISNSATTNQYNFTGTNRGSGTIGGTVALTQTGSYFNTSRLSIRPFTFSGSVLTCATHPFRLGDTVRVFTPGTLPTPLVDGTIYYAGTVATGTLSLYPTATDATNSTNVISLSGGSGTFYIFADGADIADPGSTRYVSAAALSDNSDGFDWAHAYLTIGAGVTNSNSGGTIVVATGTYASSINLAPKTLTFNFNSGAVVSNSAPALFQPPSSGINVTCLGYPTVSSATYVLYTNGTGTYNLTLAASSTTSPTVYNGTGVVTVQVNFTGLLVGSTCLVSSVVGSSINATGVNPTQSRLLQTTTGGGSGILHVSTGTHSVSNARLAHATLNAAVFPVYVTAGSTTVNLTNCETWGGTSYGGLYSAGTGNIFNLNNVVIRGLSSTLNSLYVASGSAVANFTGNCYMVGPISGFTTTGTYIRSNRLQIVPFTFSGSTVTMTAHQWGTGNMVIATSSNNPPAPPTPLADDGTAYYIHVIDANTVTLHTNSTDASTGSNAITLSGGTGTFYLTGVASDITSTGAIYADASRLNNNGDGLDTRTAKKTIAAASTAAVSGNTVQVAVGTYSETAVFGANGVTVNVPSGTSVSSTTQLVINGAANAVYTVTGAGNFTTTGNIWSSNSASNTSLTLTANSINASGAMAMAAGGSCTINFSTYCICYPTQLAGGTTTINGVSRTTSTFSNVSGTGVMTVSGGTVTLNNTKVRSGSLGSYLVYSTAGTSTVNFVNCDLLGGPGGVWVVNAAAGTTVNLTNCTIRTYAVSGGFVGAVAVNFLDGNCRTSAALTSTGAITGTYTITTKVKLWAFTFSTTTLTVTGHPFSTGDTVYATTMAFPLTLPTQLVDGTVYYVRNLTANTLQLHPTLTDANNNTNAISLSGGSGTFYITGV